MELDGRYDARRPFVVALSVLVVMIVAGSAFPARSDAHSPTDMVLEYDYASQTLSVEITHNSPATSTHYIETVEVSRNGIVVLTETYTEQPDISTFTYEYEVAGRDGDLMEVTAECNLFGSITRNTTVQGPRERMRMEVNPKTTSVGSGRDVEFTVNIYTVEGDQPLDGANVLATPSIGTVTEVAPLGLGGYTFTYSAPEVMEEQTEALNITASKNGYHSVYQETLFDIVTEVTPRVQVSILPILYRLNEGERTAFSVRVRSGTEDLDVDDISVEHSHGTLTKKKVGTGRFEIEYTPEEVAVETAAFIIVRAEKEGYLPGEKRIDFAILDVPSATGDDGDSPPSSLANTILLLGTIAAIGGALVLAVLLIWKGRKKKGRKESKPIIAQELDLNG